MCLGFGQLPTTGLPQQNSAVAKQIWRELDLTFQNTFCSMFADYLLIAPLNCDTEQVLLGPPASGARVISAACKFQARPSPAIEALQRAATPFRG